MGHYDSDWPYKAMITVDQSATPSATPDITVVVPPDWDAFWDNIDSSGDEVRVTYADGVTLANYAWASSPAFNKSTKTGTLEVDAADMEATAGCYVLWIYWQESGGGAASASTATTITSAKTGYIERGAPEWPIYVFKPAQAGNVEPEARFLKGTNEERYIWFDLEPVLRRAARASEGRRDYEEPFYVIAGVNASGSSVPSAFDQSKQRLVLHKGRRYVGVYVKGGSSGTDYTVFARVKTYVPYADGSSQAALRVLETRALMTVQDVSE